MPLSNILLGEEKFFFLLTFFGANDMRHSAMSRLFLFMGNHDRTAHYELISPNVTSQE